MLENVARNIMPCVPSSCSMQWLFSWQKSFKQQELLFQISSNFSYYLMNATREMVLYFKTCFFQSNIIGNKCWKGSKDFIKVKIKKSLFVISWVPAFRLVAPSAKYWCSGCVHIHLSILSFNAYTFVNTVAQCIHLCQYCHSVLCECRLQQYSHCSVGMAGGSYEFCMPLVYFWLG